MKKSRVFVLILILGAVLVALGLYISYNLSKPSKNEEISYVEEKRYENIPNGSLDVNSDTVKYLMKMVDMTRNSSSDHYFGFFYGNTATTTPEKDSHGFVNYYEKIKDSDILALSFYNNYDNYKKDKSSSPILKISTEFMRESIFKTFGPDIKYNLCDFESMFPYGTVVYNNEKDYFIANERGTGMTGPLEKFYRTKIVSASKDDEEIDILQKVGLYEIVFDSETDPYKYHYKLKGKDGNIIADNISSDIDNYTEFDDLTYSQYQDKLKTYKFTFKKASNDNYYYYKSEQLR